MPTLSQTIPNNDLGFVRIVASLWGLELESNEPAEAALELAETICDAELLEEIVSTLPDDGQAALGALVDEGGRIPWGQFTRRFGEIREMGPARRDREQPHQRPASAAEMLWYRALLARAFFDTPKGPQEFAFIPDDLSQALGFIGFKPAAPEPIEESEPAPRPALHREPQYEAIAEPEYAPLDEETPENGDLESARPIPTVRSARPPLVKPPARPPVAAPSPSKPPEAPTAAQPLGRAASPSEKAHIIPATDRILDDATTLLAAMRMGMDAPALGVPAPVLTALLTASRLISGNVPQPEPVKSFLEAPRPAALQALFNAWLASPIFNELRLLPGLAFEGGWDNHPLETRQTLFGLLGPIPPTTWWSIGALTRDVKQKQPDFQRPAGDYDTWFIKRESDGVFLRGFAHWDDVDGALIRQFLQVLHWLGQLDLASAEEGGPATAFRISESKIESQRSKELRPSTFDETGKLVVNSNGRIIVPRLTPRTARYQIARFCEWDDAKDDEYRYRVTVKSLTRAREQGLKPDHLIKLLQKYASAPLPPPFVRALQRWELNGTEARVETLTVLKVKRPEVLEELRKSKAGRFLGEIIGPTTVTIQGGAISKVMAALAELGLLADGEIE